MYQRHHIISEGIELLLKNLQITPRPDYDFDVIVVGSGYGGAVAAARLSEVFGDRLCVLERGEEYPLGKFPANAADMPNLIRIASPQSKKSFGNPTGLYDLRLSKDVNVLVGSGLGGGSLINAGVMAKPTEQIFELKDTASANQLRRIWPQNLTHASLAQSYAKARGSIEPEKIPKESAVSNSEINSAKIASRASPQKVLAMKRLAYGVGLAAEFSVPEIAVTFQARRNVHGVIQNACIQCGDCFTGCNYGAKNTLDRNYLSTAYKFKAKIYVGVTVLRIEKIESDAGWLVHFDATAPELRSIPVESKTIKCKYLVLSGGTLGSTEILKRSPSVVGSKMLGKSFSGNGDMIAVGANHTVPINAVVDPSLAAKYRKVGPTIASMIDLRTHGKWKESGTGPVIQELAAPGALRWLFSEVVGNAKFLQRFTVGDYSTVRSTSMSDPAAIDLDELANSQIYAMFGVDKSQGELTAFEPLPGDSFIDGRLSVSWDSVRQPPVVNLFTETHAIVREMIQDSEIGDGLLANPMWEPFSPAMASALFGAKRGPLISVHPLGGCPMADLSEFGVVNCYGQVFKEATGDEVHASLVVLDGSIIPTSLGINPGLTISALAEYAVDYLLKHWTNLSDDASGSRQHNHLIDSELLVAPPLSSGVVENPSSFHPSGIALSERMLGVINLPRQGREPERTAKISMELSIGPILDVNVFQSDPDHTLLIQAAKVNLQLAQEDGFATTVSVLSVSGSVKFAKRVPTNTWQRRIRSVYGVIVNGYLADIVRTKVSPRVFSGKTVSIGERLKLVLPLTSVLGEVREYRYELFISRDFWVDAAGQWIGKEIAPSAGHVRLFAKGDQLVGKKTFQYGFKANPWIQFTTLEMYLQRKDSDDLVHIGCLKSDLSYFANFNTYLLKVFQQGDMTTTFANIASLVAFFGRAIFGAHLLTFKTQKYKVLAQSEFEPAASEPKALKGIGFKKHTFVVSQESPKELGCLTHYWFGNDENVSAQAKSVLFIHGFGASANTFTQTTPSNRNIVTDLVSERTDVWLLDLRTSNASPVREQYFSFDKIGDEDIVEAFNYISTWKKNNFQDVSDENLKLQVVAHCVGVAMISHPLLSGKLRNRISKMVMTQVGLVVELTAYNHARNALVAGIRQFVGNDYIDTRVLPEQANLAIGDRKMNVPAEPPALDWLFSSFVYRPSEWFKLSSWWSHPKWLAQYNRMSVVYAPLMNVLNVRAATLKELHKLIAGVNIRGYSQTLFYSMYRRVTNKHGSVLPSVQSICDNIDFPVLFLAGEDNRVFHSEGAVRSAQLVANAWAQGNISDKRDAFQVEIPGYGHQDIWLGRNAYRDVLPLITSFLKGTHQLEAVNPTIFSENGLVRTAYTSVLGPTMGWLRKTVDGWIVRVQFTHDQVAKSPESILCFIDRVDTSAPAALQQLGALSNDRVYYDVGNQVFQQSEILVVANLKPCQVSDPDETKALLASNVIYLDIPIAKDCYAKAECGELVGIQIFLVSIHDNEPIDTRSNTFELPNEYFEFVQRLQVAAVHQGVLPNQGANVLWDGLKDRLKIKGFSRNQTNVEIARLGFPDLDKLQTFPALFLSNYSLAAADGDVFDAERPRLTNIEFAVASCQAPQFVFDREMAGASYRRIASRLDSLVKEVRSSPPDRGVSESSGIKVPDFLLAIGDQIYMDASVTAIGSPVGLASLDKPYVEWLGNNDVRSVFSRIPVYPMLDDHEFENFYVATTATPTAKDSCVFDLYQTYQRKLAPDQYGLKRWYTLNKGGFPFFILDTRSERDAKTSRTLHTSKIISDRQSAALEAWLLQHKNSGKPLFIASPSVVFPMHSRKFKDYGGDSEYALGLDGWDGYPGSLEKLLAFICLNSIQNVVFLCGDYHISAVSIMELRAANGSTVSCLSVVSSGSYLPYRSAISRRRNIAFGVDTQNIGNGLSYRYRTFESTITNANSIAVITAASASENPQAGPQISVTFDTSEGPLHFSRELSRAYGEDLSSSRTSTSAIDI
jgi:cholesterol oxidase